MAENNEILRRFDEILTKKVDKTIVYSLQEENEAAKNENSRLNTELCELKASHEKLQKDFDDCFESFRKELRFENQKQFNAFSRQVNGSLIEESCVSGGN